MATRYQPARIAFETVGISRENSIMSNTSVESPTSPWTAFSGPIRARLSTDDDADLWQIAMETVIGAAELPCADRSGKLHVTAQVGRCSHWLAPNKARWITSAGEFALPAGYIAKGGRRGWFSGLPELDWEMFWERDETNGKWRHVPDIRAPATAPDRNPSPDAHSLSRINSRDVGTGTAA